MRLLMWEIGKTRRDAEREFDRTLEYIAGTIDALKELDRASSPLPRRGGDPRPGPPGAARRRPLPGPVQLPAERDLHHPDPGADHGQHGRLEAAASSACCSSGRCSRRSATASRPGVVNTVYGEGKEIVGPLMASGKVDCLAFIGTHRVADLLKKQHPRPHRLRCVLGLDAKNPAIVLPDADLDLAVARVRARRALLQRPALHRAQDPVRARVGGRGVPGAASRRGSRRCGPACPGSRR